MRCPTTLLSIMGSIRAYKANKDAAGKDSFLEIDQLFPWPCVLCVFRGWAIGTLPLALGPLAGSPRMYYVVAATMFARRVECRRAVRMEHHEKRGAHVQRLHAAEPLCTRGTLSCGLDKKERVPRIIPTLMLDCFFLFGSCLSPFVLKPWNGPEKPGCPSLCCSSFFFVS